jgi:hypothetical protein
VSADAWVSLNLFLAGQFVHACADLSRVQAGVLYERFFGWLRAPGGRRRSLAVDDGRLAEQERDRVPAPSPVQAPGHGEKGGPAVGVPQTKVGPPGADESDQGGSCVDGSQAATREREA